MACDLIDYVVVSLTFYNGRAHHEYNKESLEKVIATDSSILAWRIPGTEEPSGLQSRESQRVGHGSSDLAHTLKVKSQSEVVSDS